MTRDLWDLVGRCVTISLHKAFAVLVCLQVARDFYTFASQNVTLSSDDFELIWVHKFMLKYYDSDAEDWSYLVYKFKVMSLRIKAHKL